jgi:hypothetical protein
MAERYDLKVARQGRDGKSYWTKTGVMFPMKDRDGFNISLEALPLQSMNDQGQMECRITAWESFKEGENQAGETRQRPQETNSSSNSDFDPEKIPF